MRVGKALADLTYPADVDVLDGLDWFWVPSLIRGLRFLRRERPEIIVLQWWTGTVLHTYLVLALAARLMGAKVVIEYHEALDTGELALAPARWYVSHLAPLLFRLAQGAMFHSEFDRSALKDRYKLHDQPAVIAPHGPYDQYVASESSKRDSDRAHVGSESVICCISELSVHSRASRTWWRRLSCYRIATLVRFSLTIVARPGRAGPSRQMIERSSRRDSISFINRYVSDEEVGLFFGAADAVVLPYHRSSASGPLHLAMAEWTPGCGDRSGWTGGGEVDGYEGARTVPAHDPSAIAHALREVHGLRGQRFACVHSWQWTIERYEELFEQIMGSPEASG